FPNDGRLARHNCVLPAIQTASDNVEPPSDKPPRPLRAARKINDSVVRLVELDVEKANDLFSEPLDVCDRAQIQLIERREAAEGDETPQLRARDHIIAQAPRYRVVIWRLSCHSQSVFHNMPRESTEKTEITEQTEKTKEEIPLFPLFLSFPCSLLHSCYAARRTPACFRTGCSQW